MIFRNLVFAALAIGIVAGLALSLVQKIAVVPTIIAAEVYEIAEEAPVADAHSHHSEHGHAHNEEAWGPEDGAERTFYTVVANILAAIGFSLVLLAGMSLSGKTSILAGVLWGLAGYIAFFVAPGLGLHPEIPGMEAAQLEGRQGWWMMTVSFTAIGLALIAFGQIGLKVGGVVILLVPHIMGAPLPEAHGFSHPDPAAVAVLEQLAQDFITATAVANAVFWLVMGTAAGFVVSKFDLLKTTEA